MRAFASRTQNMLHWPRMSNLLQLRVQFSFFFPRRSGTLTDHGHGRGKLLWLGRLQKNHRSSTSTFTTPGWRPVWILGRQVWRFSAPCPGGDRSPLSQSGGKTCFFARLRQDRRVFMAAGFGSWNHPFRSIEPGHHLAEIVAEILRKPGVQETEGTEPRTEPWLSGPV